jgi:hypothetical protein
LFADNEQGVWYDPSDMTTMFQDAAGTTPVTAVEQPVGLMLDKSKGLILGPELVVNGGFYANINGWVAGSELSNISWVSGKLRVSTNSTQTVEKSAYQPLPVVAGRTYKISGTATLVEGQVSATHVVLRDGVDSGTSNLVASTVLSMGSGAEAGFIYTATTTTTLYLHCRIFNTTAPATVDYDNISVRELPGNHATQATAASRPILRQDANGKYYLFFDGVDDSLATAAINFTSTDKMTVFAGVRKLSDAATGMLVELSANVSSNAGSFYVSAPESTSRDYAVASNGTAGAAIGYVDSADYLANITKVITGKINLAGATSAEVRSARFNGVDVALTYPSAILGGGNFGNYPLYIGRRSGTSLPFNGHLYSLIVRGAQSTDAQIVSAETYVNSKTGAY